jgi:hypothetical protein
MGQTLHLRSCQVFTHQVSGLSLTSSSTASLSLLSLWSEAFDSRYACSSTFAAAVPSLVVSLPPLQDLRKATSSMDFD